MPGAVSRCYQRVILPLKGELSWQPGFARLWLTPTPHVAYGSVCTIGVRLWHTRPGAVAVEHCPSTGTGSRDNDRLAHLYAVVN